MTGDEIRAGIERIRARIPEPWGTWISCDEGWWPLLVELDEALAAIEPRYEIAQVKQKYGTLRFYLEGEGAFSREHQEQMRMLIRAAEERSATICETCGRPGTLRNPRGWMLTRCDEHAPGTSR